VNISWSYASIIVVWLSVLTVSLSHFVNHQGKQPFAISWDSYGYYLYLPATYPYGDHEDYAFTELHRDQYKVSSNIYQISTHDGETLPIYTIGMAILYSPGYVVGHAIAVALDHPQDGLSLPYQWSLIVWGWVIAFIGLYFLRKLLLQLYDDPTVACTIVTIGLGTNLFNYWSYEPMLTHGWLFSCYTVLLYLTSRWYAEPTTKRSIAVGGLAALMALIRPSEAILVLLFALYGAASRGGIVAQGRYWLKHHRHLLTLVLTGLLAVSVQVLYWYVNSGKLWHNAYVAGGHHFDFTSPHIIEGFFSWRKGWLVYTPVMVLALVGLFLRRKYHNWRLAIVAFTIVNIYVVLSWHMWWYAGSFGQRALVQSYAVLAIPLAATIDWAFAKKWTRWIMMVVLALAILLNQWQSYQYRQKILPQDGITETFYKASFFSGSLDKSLRRYLNSDERAPSHYSPGQQLAKLPLQEDDHRGYLTIGDSRTYSPVLRLSREQLPMGGSWLRITADCEALSDNFGQYNGAKLVAEIKDNGDTNKWTGIEVQKIIEPHARRSIYFDFQLPASLDNTALLQVMLWNTSPDSIYISDVTVETLE
jgi:hypothetical protein